MALYVRKQSGEEKKEPPPPPPADSTVKLRNINGNKKDSGKNDDSKKSKFLSDMARRSLEVPTDFLDKIEEENKAAGGGGAAGLANKLRREEDTAAAAKKYPFNRTTTPNSLREQLKETLVKNIGSTTDLAETIHALRDDEILDTFNIDSENIETPPVQRRAFRHKSMRLPNKADEAPEDNASDAGSDFSGRRKNHKFRSLTGDGHKALGDRELVIKKKKESNNDLSEVGGRRTTTDLEDELGSGLFDRFSSARKTLGRNSLRRKKEEAEAAEEEAVAAGDDDKKHSRSDWRSKIANKFRKSSDTYEVAAEADRAAERGQELRDYLGMVAPMTEPVRRKPFNIDDPTVEAKAGDRSEKRSSKVSTSSRGATKVPGDRKSSVIMEGDYDSTLVDGKYVTSVPIINVEAPAAADAAPNTGNIRPGRSLRDLKSPTSDVAAKSRGSIYDRLARSGSTRTTTDTSRSSVYDRLSGGGKSGSRSSLSNSRTTLSTDTAASRGLSSSRLTGTNTSRATSLPPDKPKTTLTRIRDISKDLTKNLRKGREDDLIGGAVSARGSPRGSTSSILSAGSRRPMSNVNSGSHPSINSSTRSLSSRTATLPRDSSRTAVNGGRTTSAAATGRSSGSSTPLIKSNSASTNSLKRQPRHLPSVKVLNSSSIFRLFFGGGGGSSITPSEFMLVSSYWK